MSSDRDQDIAEAHARDARTVLAALDTTPAGLSASEVAERLARYGENRLPEAPRRGPLVRFLSQFHNLLIYVLIAAAAITALMEHYIDTGVILAVVIVNAIIGFIQEGRAEQAMDAIRDMLAPHSSVVRDGRRQGIMASQIVPGDIVLLEPGERVPADMRLLEAAGLRIDEALLTGESVPSEKETQASVADAPLGDRHGMAYSGTLVTAGTGRGVAVATGPATQIGRISGLLSSVETLTTPLVHQLDGFARWLTLLILLVAGLVLAWGYYVIHMPFDELFMAVVGLAVAAIPEGLPAVLTITLAVGVQAMARRNAIVRRLPAIETLGSVSVICSDKTGTLTRNEMLAATVATSRHLFAVTGEGYSPEGTIRLDDRDVTAGEHGVLAEIARAAALCNDAALHPHEEGWRTEGDPMEGALKALAAKISGDGHEPYGDHARLSEIPFDAAHRYMAVRHRSPDGHTDLHVKGAPEQVLAMCAGQRTPEGGIEPLDKDFWTREMDAIAGRGQRVLALATVDDAWQPSGDPAVLRKEDLAGRLIILGLVGLIDPPRPEAVVAVAECHGAGIRVKMITGDHAGTAAAIGRQIGLKNPDKVLTGNDLDAMDDAELSAQVVETDIFARTSPEHKLRLVTALQAHGLTVAMTGDGVNDAPALKRADAGIAMGRKGSEAAKEAADLVLADDNFASIAAAVREGRTVYDNIKKVLSWTLPTSGGESMTVALALLLGMALPITAVQILWVNLITAVTLGISLAFEPTEDGTMRREPRPRRQPILGGALLWHIVMVSALILAGVFGIYFYAIDRGYSQDVARTMAVNTLVVLEIFHLFFIRNIYGTSLTWKAVQGTPIVWACVIIVTLAQFAITYVPTLQIVFGTAAVPFFDGVLIVMVGVAFFALIEIEKQLRLVFRRNGDGEH